MQTHQTDKKSQVSCNVITHYVRLTIQREERPGTFRAIDSCICLLNVNGIEKVTQIQLDTHMTNVLLSIFKFYRRLALHIHGVFFLLLVHKTHEKKKTVTNSILGARAKNCSTLSSLLIA